MFKGLRGHRGPRVDLAARVPLVPAASQVRQEHKVSQGPQGAVASLDWLGPSAPFRVLWGPLALQG